MRLSFLSYIPTAWRALAISLVTVLCGTVNQAQGQGWQSAVACGWVVASTATDANGNVYLAGSFLETATFGGITLTSSGSSANGDMFIAKWSPVTSSFVWAQRGGGNGSDVATDVAVSGTNVYVTGTYSSNSNVPASFGSFSLTSVSNTADTFVAKLTDAGNFVWVQHGGGTGHEYAKGMAVNGTTIYISGSSSSPTNTFGSISANTTGTGGYDAYIAKLVDAGTTGSFAWAKMMGGTNGSGGISALAVTGGNVYAVGYFGGATITFDNITLANTNPGTSNAFVAKLTDMGNASSFVWAQQAGGNGIDSPEALVVNGTSVYMAGYFRGSSATFGPTTLVNYNQSNPSPDIFVTKLTDAGNSASFTWTLQAGGLEDDRANGMVLRGNSVYITGNFAGLAATFGNAALSNAGSSNVFVTKLTDAGSTGSFIWTEQGGGLSNDFANTITLFGTTLYVGGGFYSFTQYGGTAVTGVATSNTGILAVLSENTTLATATPSALSGVSLYPNPARSIATLQLPAVAGASLASLTLLDALGRTIRTHTVHLSATTVVQLPVQNLNAGLYHVRVQTGNHVVVRSLVVE